MRRVVVTGMGIVSCIGTDLASVLASLKEGKSGIVYRPQYEERGMRSHVAGAVDIDYASLIDRKDVRFMGAAAAYGYLSLQQAIADAGLRVEDIDGIVKVPKKFPVGEFADVTVTGAEAYDLIAK